MTQQEQQLIDDLVTRIRSTQLTEKDAEAEQRLQQGLAGYPDATYVLAQTVIVQKFSLEQAQQHIQDLQAQLDELHQQQGTQPPPPTPSGSFLSRLFGTGSAQQPPPYQPVNNPGYANPGYPPPAYPPPGYGQPMYGQPMYSAPSSGGFLRNAMQTAAGVAAGEMMFQGIESLFHGHSGGYGMGGFGEGRPTEIVNNYYDDDRGSHEHHGLSQADRDDLSSNDGSNDDTSNFADDSGSDDFSNDDSGSGGDDSGF